jgi:hypothetical protein
MLAIGVCDTVLYESLGSHGNPHVAPEPSHSLGPEIRTEPSAA